MEGAQVESFLGIREWVPSKSSNSASLTIEQLAPSCFTIICLYSLALFPRSQAENINTQYNINGKWGWNVPNTARHGTLKPAKPPSKQDQQCKKIHTEAEQLSALLLLLLERS